jgi:c-di-GMP-binding flagellar brake protein YcgR
MASTSLHSPSHEDLNINEHSEHLVDSRAEILRILGSMVQSGTRVAAYMDEGSNFLSLGTLGIDEDGDKVFLEYGSCTDSGLVAQLLKSRNVCYVCALKGAKIQFIGSQPHPVVYHGHPAIQIHLPKFLWYLQRRIKPRYAPANGTLKLILNFAGIGEVEAEVADLSMDGIGIILYHPELKLEQGLILDDCEIRIPGQLPIRVKIRIQYSTTVQFADGQIFKRSGCLFIGLDASAQALLRAYLESLEPYA